MRDGSGLAEVISDIIDTLSFFWDHTLRHVMLYLMYVCDVCRVAKFPTVQAAQAHEQLCSSSRRNLLPPNANAEPAVNSFVATEAVLSHRLKDFVLAGGPSMNGTELTSLLQPNQQQQHHVQNCFSSGGTPDGSRNEPSTDKHSNSNNNNHQKNVRKRTETPTSHRVVQSEFSMKKEVDSRVYCKFTNGDYYWGIIVNKSTNNTGKVVYAVQFDDGDFLDNIEDTSDTEGEGNLYTEFAFVARAGDYPPPRPFLPQESAGANHKKPRVDTTSLTPAELYQKRCQRCIACMEQDCLICTSCINNNNRQGNPAISPECCLRKMCCHIPLNQRKQRAPGLPKGWTFASGMSKSNVVLFSPDGDQFHSFEEAMKICGTRIKKFEAARITFEDHIGGSVLWNDENHFLVGKGYCQEWTDVLGRNKIMYGIITACERDKLDEEYAHFTVTFNEQSLKTVINARAVRGWDVPQTTKMSLEWAFGGHVAYLSKMDFFPFKEKALSIPSRQWLTPDMRTATLVVGQDGKKLPRLSLVCKGYHLVFSVQESTIPNAGLGVFVQCHSMIPGSSSFRLRKGHMLDIGVYAPFRKEDFKEESVFLVKNFILGLKCEEWAFETGPTSTSYQFDITDDWTGELHEIAAQHIPAYVNECRIEAYPTVHAEHDPEGVVHYLLGETSKEFILPANGSMVELFINYGPIYERVRIRKEYSFLSPIERLAQTKSDQEEYAEYLEEIASFQQHELRSCLEFLIKLVDRGKALPMEFHCNALCAAVGLRFRAKTLMDAFNKNFNKSSTSDAIVEASEECPSFIAKPQFSAIDKIAVVNNVEGVVSGFNHVVKRLLCLGVGDKNKCQGNDDDNTNWNKLLEHETAGEHATLLSSLLCQMLSPEVSSQRIQQLVSMFSAS